MDRPAVTFVIPCFNHGAFVGQAVASALAQEDADVRVVVVDDGSTDGSTPAQCDACAGERVRVVHQSNAGLPAARNAGVAAIPEAERTEFVAFLDADDWVEPAFTRTLVAALTGEGAGEVGASHAYCFERMAELGNDWVWRTPAWDADLMLITNLHPVTALVRRSCFDELGGFDESMRDGYEDWEFWIRCVGRGWHGVRVPEPLFVWRRHSTETMIADAVAKHDRLVAHIIERNRALYTGRSEALLKRTSGLLRRFDANWLDEEHDAIQLGFQRDKAEYLERELWATRERVEAEAKRADIERTRVEESQTAAARREAELLGLLDEQADAMRQQRDAYEAMAMVRLHHATHRAINALPGPLARAGRRVLLACGSVAKRVLRRDANEG